MATNTPLLYDPSPMGTSAPALAPSTVLGSSSASSAVSGSIQQPAAPAASQQPVQPQQESIFTKSSHPTVLFFHLLFRTLAIVFYMFSWLITSSFVTTFIILILLLSFDFWTVKNVTGRLLVGLRWWNENRPINATDSSVFWFSLYAAPAIWFVFGLGALLRLSFQWTLCVVVALVLNMANVVGYTRCHKDAQSRVNNFMQNPGGGFMQGVMSSMVSNTIGGWFGGGGSTAAPAAARV
ncbi:Golgi apparatus membrane protein TVP23 A [Podochytrium sp. JEL0797]|nr:Golgi apparatus membrane protein TVP23 A [Podochytrium sp. JEL0797]